MTYKKSTDISSLADILARAAGNEVAIKPVVYSSQDRVRASNVLAKLLTRLVQAPDLTSVRALSSGS